MFVEVPPADLRVLFGGTNDDPHVSPNYRNATIETTTSACCTTICRTNQQNRDLIFWKDLSLTMPKRGRKRKKTRTHTEDVDNALLSAEEAKIPKSLVVRNREMGFLFFIFQNSHTTFKL